MIVLWEFPCTLYFAVLCLVTQSCLTLCDPMDYSLPGSSVHGDSPGQNTGMGCQALLQGIFPTQGSNPCLMSPALSGRFFTSATWEAQPVYGQDQLLESPLFLQVAVTFSPTSYLCDSRDYLNSPQGHSSGFKWHPTPVLLPGESHGWRSLAGCSPWGC